MTRKDYVAIAKAIHTELDGMMEEEKALAEYGVTMVALRLARVFADDNPRFDRARFLAACGVSS